jgi:hypothetical protein
VLKEKPQVKLENPLIENFFFPGQSFLSERPNGLRYLLVGETGQETGVYLPD